MISCAVNSRENVPPPTVGVGWSVMVMRRNRTVELSNSVATQTHTEYTLHVFKETRTPAWAVETAHAHIPCLRATNRSRWCLWGFTLCHKHKNVMFLLSSLLRYKYPFNSILANFCLSQNCVFWWLSSYYI